MNAKEQQANQISRVDRAAAILDRALELNSPERDAYIKGACGDDVELRKEVEAMLSEEDERFIIGKPSGYGITARSSTGLEGGGLPNEAVPYLDRCQAFRGDFRLGSLPRLSRIL